MASAVTNRRQLAPTVGQAGVSTGVLIRTGSSSASRTRFASGLVLRNGAWDYVIDNASRFRAGGPLPSGVIIPFGGHRVFVAALPEIFPRGVRVFSELTDPLPVGPEAVGAAGTNSHICAEVMMAVHLVATVLLRRPDLRGR